MTNPREKHYNLTESSIKINMQSTKKKIVCNSCNNNITRIIGKLPDVNEFAGKSINPSLSGGLFVQCKTCHLKFRYSELKQSDLTDLYDGGLSEWIVTENRNDWKLLLSYINQRFDNQDKKISILDVGCNRGEVLSKIDNKYNRYGLEINSIAAEFARNKSGLVVWNSHDEIPTNMKFDMIYSTDVIEHLTSPASFIKPLLDLLNDDGVLVLSTGDADNFLSNFFGVKWWYYYFPEHVAFISRKWVKLFANTNNLNINRLVRFYYHDLSIFKRFRLLVMSFVFNIIKSDFHPMILKFINKNDTSKRFQIGKGVSRDHIFVVMQKK